MNVTEKLQSDIAATKARLEALQAKLGKPQGVTPPATLETLTKSIANLMNDVEGLRGDMTKLGDRADAIALQSEIKKAFQPAESEGVFGGVFSRFNERQQARVQLAKAAHAARIAKSTNPVSWNGVWSGRA